MRIDKVKSLVTASAELRSHAEKKLHAKTSELHPPRTEEETLRLLHELEVHQIELEMQNAELRRTQEELELSRNKYTELYDFAPVGYFTLDVRGLIREVNLTGAQLLGIERLQLANKPFSRFISDADGRDIFLNHLESVLQRQGMQRCEIRLRKKDGTVIHGQLQSVAVDTVESKDCHILSSIVDGTIAKRLETEIQDARKYAESIVETVRRPLVVLSPDLKVISSNQSFYSTFKVTPEETIGNFFCDLGSRQWDIPKLRVHLEEILNHDTVFSSCEVEHDFPDIGHKIILLSARRIFRENVSSHIILLAMEDITARRCVEDALTEKRQELEELNSSLEVRIARAVDETRQKDQMLIAQGRLAAMGEMINNIAHQWRQPLNSLGLVIQQVSLFYDSVEFNRKFLEVTTGKAMQLIQHMSQTIDDFKNFFESDKEAVAFGVNHVIRHTLFLIEESFKEQKISVALHSEGNPTLTGYPNEYAHVLLNILLNARDALVANNAEVARISIHSFVEDDTTVVTITDNAGGIAEKIMGRLFDPYFSTKGPDKGTGIGLFMSKTIIEKRMGGSLTVRNTESGAEFRIEA